MRIATLSVLVLASVSASAVVVSVGCGASSPAGPPSADAGEAGEGGCAAGEIPKDDGTCRAAGVPPEACGAGFRADGKMGCDAILPAAPCAKGQMAVPGETACRDVAPCADGDWGDIPVASDTQFVNAAYAGGASDGTKSKPWQTIAPAIGVAAAGAIVAIAAGSYAEDVAIQGKAVRLWGRCPKLAEIVGTAAALGAVVIRQGADATEIRDLALRGAADGLALSGSKSILADRVWIHDTASRGVNAENTLGVTSVTLSRSLVEAGHDLGVDIVGSDATIESVVVRDTAPRASDQTRGRGISVQDNRAVRARVTIRGSLVERSREVGVFVTGSDATIEATLVRGTTARASDRTGGRGIGIEDNAVSHARAIATVRACVVEQNQEIGVFVSGSDATIEATTVRDTKARASDQSGGRGINIQYDPATGVRASATVRACLVERNRDVGVIVLATDATIDATLVRDTQTRASDGAFGDGIAVLGAGGAASAVVTASRVEGSARAGISSFGASARLEHTDLECNAIHLDGEVDQGAPYAFAVDVGDACGCAGTATLCQVLSSALAPPQPIH